MRSTVLDTTAAPQRECADHINGTMYLIQVDLAPLIVHSLQDDRTVDDDRYDHNERTTMRRTKPAETKPDRSTQAEAASTQPGAMIVTSQGAFRVNAAGRIIGPVVDDDIDDDDIPFDRR